MLTLFVLVWLIRVRLVVLRFVAGWLHYVTVNSQRLVVDEKRGKGTYSFAFGTHTTEGKKQ